MKCAYKILPKSHSRKHFRSFKNLEFNYSTTKCGMSLAKVFKGEVSPKVLLFWHKRNLLGSSEIEVPRKKREEGKLCSFSSSAKWQRRNKEGRGFTNGEIAKLYLLVAVAALACNAYLCLDWALFLLPAPLARNLFVRVCSRSPVMPSVPSLKSPASSLRALMRPPPIGRRRRPGGSAGPSSAA